MSIENLEWIEVDNYKDIPKGLWLVEDDDQNINVADFRHEKLKTIGYYFAHDVNVVRYAKLILPKEKG